MNQEESEHNEVDGMKKGVDSTGEVMHMATVCVKGLKCWCLRYHTVSEATL